MAIVWMSGAEWGTLYELDAWSDAAKVSCTTINKRSGSYSYKIDYGSNQWAEKSLPVLAEVYIQFALLYTAATSWTFCSLKRGATDIASLKLNANYKIEVCTGLGGTAYCTGVTSLQSNNWYVVELHYRLSDTNGLIELRLDGNAEANYSGDTKPGTQTDIDKIRWISPSSVNYLYIDDIMIHDITGTTHNSWPNGVKIALLKPNADGSVANWTPTPTGSHYACVDEVPPSGTDYLTAANADLLEVLGLEDLPTEAQSVQAVRVDMWGVKGSTQDPDRVQLGVRIDSTDYLSAELDLPLSQGLVVHHMPQHPAGGNWSVAAVNAMQLAAKARN